MKPFFKSRFLQKVIFLPLLLFLSPVQAEDEKKQLIFGIHPYLPATVLLEKFTPVIEYLQKQTGSEIRIKVSSSYQAHIDNMSHGTYDFAYMGPAPYIKLTEKIKDYPLLGRLDFADKNTFRGAIIIRRDSQLGSLKDLAGMRFAFGDPESTLSSRVPQRLLEEVGVTLTDLKHYSYLKNHYDVALAVLIGKYDAGGIKEEVFQKYQSRGLKVLQWSPDFPSHLFVARRNMSKAQLNKLKIVLHELHLKEDSDNILKAIKQGTTAIIPAQIEEYAQLRQFLMSEKAPEQQLIKEH